MSTPVSRAVSAFRRMPGAWWRLPLLVVLTGLLVALLALAGMGSSRAGAPPAPAPGAEVLTLEDGLERLDAWPWVRVRMEPPGQTWTAAQAVADPAAFVPPDTPHANLGVRREAAWLRVPLAVPPGHTGRWLLHIDYPSLDRIEVFLVVRGLPVPLARTGDETVYAQRTLRARGHLVPFQLPEGGRAELLLRVQTSSTMTVPLQILKAAAYAEQEAREQMAQGVLTGMSLFLLLYSLAQAVMLRDVSFACYGLVVLGTSLFTLSYFGLAQQHLWPEHVWLTQNMPPLAVLLAEVGAAIFVDRALRVRELRPRLSLALRATAGVASALALAFVCDLIPYRVAHVAATTLGMSPIVFGLPAAWARMRAGDRAAFYIVAGWGVYAVGIVVLAGLLRGWVPFNYATQHAFQASALLEMMIWMLALGARVQMLRREAERARQEREVLHALAHTDPLTGLPNRRGLQAQLAQALRGATPQRPLALLMLDLDGFKAVNDRLGHDVGDLLLEAVAQRLRQQLRAHDVVARLGGDEFVVLAPGLGGEADARFIGDKLLQAFDEPFALQGEGCRVGLTIGYALAPQDSQQPGELLRLADAALYQGKQAGKHQQRRAVPASAPAVVPLSA
ncbi:diguanylate cyclase [Ideonella livida]|uniref:GGDEF domain-containing protein n=1 Tax=Ideonella livida TaxID=2707176 RepID=A0A7C9TLX1_9BURK|nr:diguanylate cyclase [Ideonella livida]NDY92784.1 GGDEF domain-containing protein [Ideonella livida]